jgi:hypothetical protein
VAIPVGSNAPTAYNIPVNPSLGVTYAAGTGANQANKVAAPSGSAAASPSTIDLSSQACVDGQTGFSHVREVIVFNDSPTAVLTLDFTASNAWTAPFSAGGTTAKLDIQPGTSQRFNKPIGTNGFVVDSTHKILTLDPGASTVAWRAVIVGD